MKKTNVDIQSSNFISNKILLENNKEGTLNWRLTKPALNREIEGYASKSSINKGESLDLFVNTRSTTFTLTVYRMGWYGGMGGREIVGPITLEGTEQHIPLPERNTGLVECAWKKPYRLTSKKDWITGIYVVKLEEKENNKQSYILFVVRDDGEPHDVLFQLPVTTYQAYNYWGGKCLYTFGSGSLTNWGTVSGERALKVSFNRPYARSNNIAAAYGMGAGDFFTNTRPVTTHNYPTSSAGWDYNMVRWLEKNKYNVGYCTNIDLHNDRSLLNNSKIFLSSGHDEYWTDEMRTSVRNARDNGVNLAFFSSNTMYWQIRLEKSKLSEEHYRTIVCYKEVDLDPIKDKTCTINFCDIPEQGSQASLIGVQYFLDPVAGDIKIENASHWVFEGTDLKKGDRLKGLLGYEVDGVVSESPANIEILATTVCQRVQLQNNSFILKYIFSRVLAPFTSFLRSKVPTSKKYSPKVLTFTILLGLLLVFCLYYFFDALIPIFLVLGTFLFILLWFVKIKISGKVTSNMTLYQAKSGAQVFATGSMQWAWGLDDFNSPELRSSVLNQEAILITKNVLKKFGAYAES
ncbi:hypothetical protein FK220_017165 [Flavobacteriaceae bacterium TP-CH-4]|uniref:N,N-dimethylformamidase beta subunit-like C-terminal domain-containing protein n=1 Tax=Pelagihabitans pacificus TaxID=2696054 RepID=A0A967AXF2_9FLAO|nr:N,N-dimethylformamidase beta subunit family domain-containing protein [Pelagihabitans pacificus]NHF61085.1 hypothetical protein [Pelagihabitans pacificus]